MDKGGYNVQPEAIEPLFSELNIINASPLTEIQNAEMLSLGKTKSQQASFVGISTFPKNPIRIGMMKRKIIPKPCNVIILL